TDGTASSSFTFDANNRLTEARDGNGNATTYRYTRAGCGCSESDLVTAIHTPDLPAAVDWTFDYGPEGRLSSVTDPRGFSESLTYAPTGEVRTVRDRNDRVTTMTHDQLGRLASLVDTLGRTHKPTYTQPTSGAWVGPSLMTASADGSATSGSLT